MFWLQTDYNQYKADWSRETRNKKFMLPKHFHDWIMLTDDMSERLVPDFINMLERVCPGMGIHVKAPTKV